MCFISQLYSVVISNCSAIVPERSTPLMLQSVQILRIYFPKILFNIILLSPQRHRRPLNRKHFSATRSTEISLCLFDEGTNYAQVSCTPSYTGSIKRVYMMTETPNETVSFGTFLYGNVVHLVTRGGDVTDAPRGSSATPLHPVTTVFMKITYFVRVSVFTGIRHTISFSV
jgi:hypothetical protein